MFKRNRISLPLIFNSAPFPTVMTIISFVLFIGVYWLVTARSIQPYYFQGLLFALPFIFFGITTYFTVTGKLKVGTSSLITLTLIIVMSFASFSGFIFLAFDAATTFVIDPVKYERVLKINKYPNNTLIEHFPNKIPDNAQHIFFIYNPAFLQGGERFGLRFNTDSNSIKNYVNEFSQKSKWTGKLSNQEIQENGIYSSSFDILDYAILPEDYTIYLIDSACFLNMFSNICALDYPFRREMVY